MLSDLQKAKAQAEPKGPKTNKSGRLEINPAVSKMLQNPPSARQAALYLASDIAATLSTGRPLTETDIQSLLTATNLLSLVICGKRAFQPGHGTVEDARNLSLRLSE